MGVTVGRPSVCRGLSEGREERRLRSGEEGGSERSSGSGQGKWGSRLPSSPSKDAGRKTSPIVDKAQEKRSNCAGFSKEKEGGPIASTPVQEVVCAGMGLDASMEGQVGVPLGCRTGPILSPASVGFNQLDLRTREEVQKENSVGCSSGTVHQTKGLGGSFKKKKASPQRGKPDAVPGLCSFRSLPNRSLPVEQSRPSDHGKLLDWEALWMAEEGEAD